MEDPDVPELLRYVATLNPDLDIDVHEATFFPGQETILASDQPGGLARRREHLFADRVVEVGACFEM